MKSQTFPLGWIFLWNIAHCALSFFCYETWAHFNENTLKTLGQAIKLSTCIYHCRGTDDLKLKKREKNCYVPVLFDINSINICEYFLNLSDFTMQVCTRVENGVLKKLTSVLLTTSGRPGDALSHHEASMCVRFRPTGLSLLWSSCNHCGCK